MKIRISVKSFWPAILAFAVATTLFLLPGEQFPEEDWFGKIFLDKWIHVGLFAGLVSTWCLPFIHRIEEHGKLRSIFIKITLGFILYGIAIEFIQGNFIPFRTFGVDDMIADALGCGVGLWFANYQLKIQNVKRS
jgi:H+/Cl- antiporter ClcA